MKINFLIPLIAGLGLLCACKGKNSAPDADTTSATLSKIKNTSPKSDTAQSNSKLVKTADIHFKVKNVQQTSEKIALLTASINGTVVHQLINSSAGNSVDIRKSNDSLMRVTIVNTTAEMTVKVPPGSLENFVNQVGRMGVYVNNSRMDITDKTLDYLSTRLKLKNQIDLVTQQKNAGGEKKDPDYLLAFKNNMVDQQIGNRKIDDSVKNSVIMLSFYESNVVNREIIANDDLSAYNLPILKRLGIAFENGWDLFVYMLIAVANCWIFVLLGLAIFIGIKHYRNKIALAKVE